MLTQIGTVVVSGNSYPPALDNDDLFVLICRWFSLNAGLAF